MLLPRSDSEAVDGEPTSPHSYWFPLLLIVVSCAGYLIYRRRTRWSEAGKTLKSHFTNPSTGVRLSEDGPPTHSFISNNASTDSLPSHALQDLPILPSQPTSARASPSSSSPIPTANRTTGKYTHSRRSKATPSKAVEDSDSDSDNDSEDDQEPNGNSKTTFEIGPEDEDDDDHLGPLGR